MKNLSLFKKVAIYLSFILSIFIPTYVLAAPLVTSNLSGSIPTMDMWTSTTTPDAITQRTFGRALKITGLNDGCLNLTSGILTSTGSACGAGGGSGGGTWSTTTNAFGRVLNYSNNTTDVVMIGSNTGTTTAEMWFDPNGTGQTFLQGTTTLAYANFTTPFVAASGTLLNVFGYSSNPQLSRDQSIVTIGNPVTQQLTIGAQPAAPFGMWLQVKQSTNSGSAYPLLLNPIGSGGTVGVGTLNPLAKLHVAGVPGGSIPAFRVDTVTAGYGATTTSLVVAPTTGFVGIASSTPTDQFSVTGDTHLDGFVTFGSTSPFAIVPTNETVHIVKNVDGYAGTSLINRSAGTFASVDLLWNNNLTDVSGTKYYADCGFNGSNNADPLYTGLGGGNGFYCYNTDGSHVTAIATTSSNAYIAWLTGGLLSANEKMRLTQAGRLAIGTTTPSTKLHVAQTSGDAILTLDNTGNGNTSGIDFTRQRNSGAGITGGSIFIDSNTADNSSTMFIQTQSAGAGAGVTGALAADNGVRLRLLSGGLVGGSADGEFAVETGASERFRITNSGWIGIGTSTPNEVVHIRGANDTGDIGLRLTNASANALASTSILFGVTTNEFYNGAEIRHVRSPGNDLQFWNNNNFTGVFTGNNRLALGTSTADGRFDIYDVSGTIPSVNVIGGTFGVDIARFTRTHGTGVFPVSVAITGAGGLPQIQFRHGTTSASTTFSIASDINSNTIRIATGTALVFNAAGVEPFQINRITGNVGIATSSPWGEFSINPAINPSNPSFVIGSSTKTDMVVFTGGRTIFGGTSMSATEPQLEVAGDGNIYSSSPTAAGLMFRDRTSGQKWQWYGISSTAHLYNGSSNRLSVTTAGNVGIGTSTPTSGLSIYGSGQTTSAIDTEGSLGGSIKVIDSGTSAGNGGSILFGFNNSNIGRTAAGIKLLAVNGSGNGTGDLAFSIRNATGDSTLTERMILKANGFVGIGTTSPSTRLTVYDTSSSHIRFGFSDQFQWTLGRDSTAGRLDISDQSSTKMSILNSGNVGIATTTPQSTLSIGSVNDGTASYGQMDTSAGAPPAGDCDSVLETGRFILDTTNNRLYICNGTTRLWDYSALTD